MNKWRVFLVLFLCASQLVCSAPNPVPIELKVNQREGYGNESAIGENTTDLTNQLNFDSSLKDPLFETLRFDRAMFSWYSWKQEVFELHGFQFSLAYSSMGQYATETRPGRQDLAAGGVFDFGGTWALLKRDSDWQGMLGFRIADQHRLGTSVAPSGLGDEIGSAWGTSLAFDNIPFNAIEGWWEQSLGGRAAVRFGKLDVSGIFDPAALGNPFEHFMGHPFNLNSTIPFPAEGIGAIALLEPIEDFSIVAGLVDANGNGSDWDFDSFFRVREYLKLAAMAWTPEFSYGKGEYHLTVWNSDKRVDAKVPGGKGFVIHGEQRVGDVIPFFRYGHSSGGAAALKNMIAAGVGFYHPFGRSSDGIGLGLSWGEPFGAGLRDQYGIEAYYRIQLTNEIAMTPDIQFIVNPARNSNVNTLLVLSLRLRANF